VTERRPTANRCIGDGGVDGRSIFLRPHRDRPPALVTSPDRRGRQRSPLAPVARHNDGHFHLNVISPDLCPPARARPSARPRQRTTAAPSLPLAPPPESEHDSNRTAHPHTQKNMNMKNPARPIIVMCTAIRNESLSTTTCKSKKKRSPASTTTTTTTQTASCQSRRSSQRRATEPDRTTE